MAAAAVLALTVITGSCSLPEQTPLTPTTGTVPGDASIERVLFLVGDGGETPIEGSPLFDRVAEEVEAWSRALAADSAVAVVFLGDNVYPNGVHAAGHPDRQRDSLRLARQIEIVAGPEARRFTSPGIFVPGNHDWGGQADEPGAALLRNQEIEIERAHDAGIPVDLMPPATDPGPEVMDFGPHLKLVAIDTQWWLSNKGTLRRNQAAQQVVGALQEPAGRFVLLAGHHPITTGGPHGGTIPFFPTLGIKKLIHLMGANGQDVTAVPYIEMIEDLRSAVQGSDATVLYAAGHEHGLQVIRGTQVGDPAWMLVSGSASKTSPMGPVDGSRFYNSAAGFMKLLIGVDGGLTLEVVAETPDGFQTVFAHRIR